MEEPDFPLPLTASGGKGYTFRTMCTPLIVLAALAMAPQGKIPDGQLPPDPAVGELLSKAGKGYRFYLCKDKPTAVLLSEWTQQLYLYGPERIRSFNELSESIAKAKADGRIKVMKADTECRVVSAFGEMKRGLMTHATAFEVALVDNSISGNQWVSLAYNFHSYPIVGDKVYLYKLGLTGLLPAILAFEVPHLALYLQAAERGDRTTMRDLTDRDRVVLPEIDSEATVIEWSDNLVRYQVLTGVHEGKRVWGVFEDGHLSRFKP